MAHKANPTKLYNQGDGTREIRSLNVHGTTSSRQPTAELRIIPAERFPSVLFEWPEFSDSEFISILTKTDEILN